jgi:hypothetical protein
LILFGRVTPVCAQHGDYILGTGGSIAGAQQPPEGILYQNLLSYFQVSGNGFLQSAPIKCGPLGQLCLSVNFNARGSLDLFIDQNIFWLVTPFKIPVIDATYGAMVDVPFAIADTSGAGSIEPVLVPSGLTTAQLSLGPIPVASGGVTKGSIGDIYVEPIDLGWHFKQLDALVTGAFMAPTGPYSADKKVNIGYGNWTGVLGLGGVFYPDCERTWSLSLFAHYETYSSQQGRPYTRGDEVPFEWAVGKSLNLPSEIFKQLMVGAVGYAQWQTTDNKVDVTPSTPLAGAVIHRLENARARIYAAGPEIQLLTKFGLFALRYYDEFGARATPSGQQLMFSVTLAGNPWSR